MKATQGDPTLWHALVMGMPYWYLWALCLPLVAYLARRFPLIRERWLGPAAVQLGFAFAATLVIPCWKEISGRLTSLERDDDSLHPGGPMTALLLAVLTGALTGAPQGANPQPLVVTTAWLADHLPNKGLILFQIGDPRTRAVYDSAHIPGAQFLAPLSEFSTPRVEGNLRLELPSVATLDSVLESKGVSDDSRIVLYFAREYFSPTSRAFFTLEYMGLAGRVSILDGGLEAWQAEGRAVSSEVPRVTAGHFTPQPHPELVADAEFVKAHLEDKGVRIVDARDTAFYNGRETGQGRNGHIPGAASFPFGGVVDSSGKFVKPVQLKAALAQAGITDGQTVVSYCHIGQQASLVWFAARYLGFTARLYDGSFQDWAARSELPVVNPAAPKPE